MNAVNRSHGTHLQYLPGLDGLRALAVIAVVLFHARPGVLPGGFLGVEIFFVISGFIITTGLAREFGQDGRIALRAFWRRRALRLFPAVALLLVAVLTYAQLASSERLPGLRDDTIASVLYVTNWYLVADGQSYFGGFEAPSLLKHLWSLAIEEQYYLVWPLAMAAGLAMFRRRVLAALLVVGAIASAGLMVALHEGGADVSRLYYGTDTRASGLLIGSALALAWPAGQVRGRLPGLNSAGILAVGALACFCVSLSDSSPVLYRGGFFAVDIATAILIVAVVTPATRVAKGFSLAPLRWVGVRSYGLYLWHWPIILVVTPHFAWPGGAVATFAIQVAATTVVAAASYRWVEAPVRRLGVRGAWHALTRPVRLPFAMRLARAAGAMAAVSSTALVVGLALTARPPAEPDYFRLESVRVMSAVRATPTPNAQVSGVSFAASPEAGTGDAQGPQAPDVGPLGGAFAGELSPEQVEPAEAPAAAAAPGPAIDLHVTAVGDSVMLGAANQLAAAVGGIDVDAMVSRSMDAAIGVLESRYETGTLANVVLLHIGNNGPIRDEQMDRIASLVGSDRRVLFLSLRVPRGWETGNNDVIARGVERHANFRLLDWRALSEDRPDVIWKDGIHLRPDGATYYAALVQAALAAD